MTGLKPTKNRFFEKNDILEKNNLFLVFGSAVPHHSENSNGFNEDAFDNLRNDFFFSSFHNDGKR